MLVGVFVCHVAHDVVAGLCGVCVLCGAWCLPFRRLFLVCRGFVAFSVFCLFLVLIRFAFVV